MNFLKVPFTTIVAVVAKVEVYKIKLNQICILDQHCLFCWYTIDIDSERWNRSLRMNMHDSSNIYG